MDPRNDRDRNTDRDETDELLDELLREYFIRAGVHVITGRSLLWRR